MRSKVSAFTARQASPMVASVRRAPFEVVNLIVELGSYLPTLSEQDHALMERRLPVAHGLGLLCRHMVSAPVQPCAHRLVMRQGPAPCAPCPQGIVPRCDGMGRRAGAPERRGRGK